MPERIAARKTGRTNPSTTQKHSTEIAMANRNRKATRGLVIMAFFVVISLGFACPGLCSLARYHKTTLLVDPFTRNNFGVAPTSARPAAGARCRPGIINLRRREHRPDRSRRRPA